MNKIELSSLIREIVQFELKKLARPLIEKLLKEEVKNEVDRLLTKMEDDISILAEIAHRNTRQTNAIGKNPARINRPISIPGMPPSINFTKNAKLNSILTQTVIDIRDGKTSGIVADGRNMPHAYMEGMPSKSSLINSVRPALNDKIESSGKSVNSMLPKEDVNGNPLHINENAVPDHIANALTRDYSKFLKTVAKKR